MKLIRYVACVLAFGSMTVFAGAQSAKAHKMTGWISDSHCGAAKHDAACVKKCINGGSKAVFVDKDKKVWQIDNADAVSNYYGDHVKVKATVDSANDSIHVDKVAKDSSAM